MHIGSIFPISSLLMWKALIPIVPEKMKRRKRISAIDNLSQLSHAKLKLKLVLKAVDAIPSCKERIKHMSAA